MIKPFVQLTKKDKLELGYVSDSAFCRIFNSINQIFKKDSLDLSTLNIHQFCNKHKYKDYYLVLTTEFEKSSFEYVQAKEIGFNIGKNNIKSMTSTKGSTIKSVQLANGAVTTDFTSMFKFATFVDAPGKVLELDEDHYQKTWFLIEKSKYDMWFN